MDVWNVHGRLMEHPAIFKTSTMEQWRQLDSHGDHEILSDLTRKTHGTMASRLAGFVATPVVQKQVQKMTVRSIAGAQRTMSVKTTASFYHQ